MSRNTVIAYISEWRFVGLYITKNLLQLRYGIIVVCVCVCVCVKGESKKSILNTKRGHLNK
jgi:hypothetical protein